MIQRTLWEIQIKATKKPTYQCQGWEGWSWKAGLGGRREGGEDRMDSFPSHNTTPQLPETPSSTHLSWAGLPVSPPHPPHPWQPILPFSFSNWTSNFSFVCGCSEKFPKAKKTFISAHFCCLDLGTASPQSKGKGRKENLWHHWWGWRLWMGGCPATHPSHPLTEASGRRGLGAKSSSLQGSLWPPCSGSRPPGLVESSNKSNI